MDGLRETEIKVIEGGNLIEIVINEPIEKYATVIFRHNSQNYNSWTLEKECNIANYEEGHKCVHSFDPKPEIYTRNKNGEKIVRGPEEKALIDKNGWTILKANLTIGEFNDDGWVEEVEAKKGQGKIYVNLKKNLEGSTDALIDFLKSYKESITFWDYWDTY